MVILYERHDSLDKMICRRGEVLQNRFGKFYHDDIIGKPFGTRVKSFFNDGYLYVLRPTPELWCDAAVRRTQIVNELDAGFIIFHLDLFPGCVVVESGTGSGCMTCSMARTVSPLGHVHTFEYNAVRAEAAREEFRQLGMSHLVSVQCHDVCGKLDPAGAGFPGIALASVDAVFLDLPEPWHAVAPARKVLKGGANVCCYSPCIEQCIRTFEALRREGFHSIHMFEIRQRPFDGRVIEFEQLDLGVVVPPAAEGGEMGSKEGPCAEGAMEVQLQVQPEPQPPAEPDPDDNTFPKYVPVHLPTKPMQVLRAINTMKGHTAFLTFAVKSTCAADGDFEEVAAEDEEAGAGGGGSRGGAEAGQGEELRRKNNRAGASV